jgi:hypothetical protein
MLIRSAFFATFKVWTMTLSRTVDRLEVATMRQVCSPSSNFILRSGNGFGNPLRTRLVSWQIDVNRMFTGSAR